MENETLSFIQNFGFVQNQRDNEMRDLILAKLSVENLKYLEMHGLKSEQRYSIIRNLVKMLSYTMTERDGNEYEQVDMTLVTQQHIMRVATLDVFVTVNLTLTNMNNLGVYLFLNDQSLLAKKIFKFLQKHFPMRPQILDLMIMMNLARIHYASQNYQKSFNHAEKALIIAEPYCFGLMRQQNSQEIVKDIMLLLNGYQMLAKSLEKLGQHNTLSPSKFYQNGHRLARRYLGANHYMTKKFLIYDRKGICTPKRFSEPRLSRVAITPLVVDRQCLNILRSIKKELVPIIGIAHQSSDSIPKNEDEPRRFKIRQMSRPHIHASNSVHQMQTSQEQVTTQGHFVKVQSSRLTKQGSASNLVDVSKKNSVSGEHIQAHYQRADSGRHRQIHSLHLRDTEQPNIESMIQKKFDELINQQTKIQEKQKVDDRDAQIQKLQSENINLQQERSIYSKQIDELKQQIQRLSDESNNFKNKFKDYEQTQEQLQLVETRYQQLREQQAKQVQELEHLKQINEMKQSKEKAMAAAAAKDLKPSQPEMKASIGVIKQKSDLFNMELKQSIHGKVSIKHANTEEPTNLILSIPNTPQQNNNSVQKRLNKLTMIDQQQQQVQQPAINLSVKQSSLAIPIESSPIVIPKREPGKQKFLPVYSPMNKDALNISASQDIKNLITNLSSQQQRTNQSSKEQQSISNFSDSVLQADPNTFIFSDGQDNYYHVAIMLDTVLQKRITLDGIQYDVQCSLIKTKDVQLKLRVMQVDSQDPNQDKFDYLDLNVLRDILPITDYMTLLPHSLPLRAVSDYKTFIQYLVIPFVGVNYVNNELKVEMWQYAPGLLPEQTRIWIFDEECQLILHHLQGDDFRLVFSSQKQDNSTFMIDLRFDQSSSELFFQQISVDEMGIEEVADMLKLMDLYSEGTPDEQSRQELASLVERRRSRGKVYNLQNYIVKDYNRFLQFCEKIKTDLQGVLQKQFSITSISDLKEIIEGKLVKVPTKPHITAQLRAVAVKIWDKAVSQRVVIVCDDQENSNYEVYLANLFETFAPQKTTIRAEGCASITYVQIAEQFGQMEDKSIIDYLMVDHYDLDVFERELEPDDYDRYRENMIIEVGINSEMNLRLFQDIGGYKHPISVCYMGINDKPVGIKVQTFDMESIQGTGVFIIFNHIENWFKPDKTSQAQKKKRVVKYMSERKSCAHYHYTKVLGRIGLRLVSEKLKYDGMEVVRQLANRTLSRVERFENVINFNSVLEALN